MMNPLASSSSWQISDGATVYDIDGEKIGTVRNYDPAQAYIDIKKGWLFTKDFFVGFDAIDDVTVDGVFLKVSKATVENDGYTSPPDTARTTPGTGAAGTGAPSADTFTAVREPAMSWDADQPVVREDEQYDKLSDSDTFPSKRINSTRLVAPNH